MELCLQCITYTSLLLYCVVTVSSRSSCGPNFSEGDKWFDGCNWCVCSSAGQICTNASCDHQATLDVTRCKDLGESWRDGCFHCRCLPDGIRCKVSTKCLSALKDVKAECKERDLCICGMDGVPSCTDQVSTHLESQGSLVITPEIQNDGRVLPSLDANGQHIVLNSNDDNDLNGKSISFLPTAVKNKCEVGPRWYSGALRCYCHPKKGVICGNPRFIARKVDGFKIRTKKCVAGKVWEERCRICTCKKDGFSFCRIDRECVKNKNIRHGNMNEPVLTGGNQKCKRGSRWKEGCKRCRCNKRGTVICKTRLCNQSGNDKTEIGFKSRGVETGGTAPFRLPTRPQFRMPDALEGFRFHRRPTPTPKANCNGFMPGEKYWDKCNLCHCTANGSPLCSSKLC